MSSLLSALLPLAADPFPPTHVAGSEFEGYFIRLQSHSGRSTATKSSHSVSRIPTLNKQHDRSESTSSSSSYSGTSSPTPLPKTPSQNGDPMLTALKPSASSDSSTTLRSQLPAVAPSDLIVVICELQSAPVEQRICVCVRYIVHGEEESERQRYSSSQSGRKKHVSAGESFELTTFVPSWQLKLGPKANSQSVQPFRIDLPCAENPGQSFGYMTVSKTGDVVVDITVPNDQQGTRVRISTYERIPWCSPSSLLNKLPMGSRGPESLLQHLGLLLPLHWYVHSSCAPASFSIEHVTHPYAIKGTNEVKDTVAAGRGSMHHEKNWGQSFPTGWLWIQGSSPLSDSSISPSQQRKNEPIVRLMSAGGSTLGLTAFLIGIHISNPSSGRKPIQWDFTPPFALGPGVSFADGPSARVHYGVGFRLHRDFKHKTIEIQVWDYRKWAKIRIQGDEHTFATQLPGPVTGGWAPGYCHHSYRCTASIVLFERPISSIPASILSIASNPVRTLRSISALFSRQQTHDSLRDLAWCNVTGWRRVGEFRLDDRVALEFGGDFAK